MIMKETSVRAVMSSNLSTECSIEHFSHLFVVKLYWSLERHISTIIKITILELFEPCTWVQKLAYKSVANLIKPLQV